MINTMVNIAQEYEREISTFHPISLGEMDKSTLMNRIDTKFIFHRSDLYDILGEIHNDYAILQIDNQRVFCYDSLYVDTNDFLMYKHHHNGKPRRMKLRYRTYCHSGDIFFEIKQRINPLRTYKCRVKVDSIPPYLGDIERQFLHEKGLFFGQELEHKLIVAYKRMTLVALDGIERVTIDTQLAFDNFQHHIAHEQLVIAEIKQERFSRVSPFVHALRKRNIKEHSISKYALGLIELDTEVKSNAFKSKVTIVEQIERRL